MADTPKKKPSRPATRAKEQRFIDEANKPFRQAKVIGFVIALALAAMAVRLNAF